MNGFHTLPVEMMYEILVRLDGISLGRCRRVDKFMKDHIDNNDYVWERICFREYKYPTIVAQRKFSKDLPWFCVYRNLVMWSKLDRFEKEVKQFYIFSNNDINHALDVEYGVLPLKETRGVVLYDVSTLKLIPVAVPDRNITKISNNDIASVILLKSGLFIQRTVINDSYMSQAFFKADFFVLVADEVYFIHNQEISVCPLNDRKLYSYSITTLDNYVVREMQYCEDKIYFYTKCGFVIKMDLHEPYDTELKAIDIPMEWIPQIKHIKSITSENFVCYSSNLFKIETDNHRHLYLHFPSITALFFYVDFVLIGTQKGEILLYRLSSQKKGMKPIFEKIAQLPDKKYALHLDVCERESGPLIIVSTFYDIILIYIKIQSPDVVEKKKPYPPHLLPLIKRMSILRDRLRVGVPARQAVA